MGIGPWSIRKTKSDWLARFGVAIANGKADMRSWAPEYAHR